MLSPFLFNIYVDCIRKILNVTKLVRVLGNIILNNIFYADDLVLISPSLKGLQKLMNICYDYGTKIDILFCETKTKCVIFKIKRLTFMDYQCTVLENQKIMYCKDQKYLGHIYHNDDDIWRQKRSSLLAIHLRCVFAFALCFIIFDLKCYPYLTNTLLSIETILPTLSLVTIQHKKNQQKRPNNNLRSAFDETEIL